MSDVAKYRDGLDEKTRRRADGDLAAAIADAFAAVLPLCAGR